MTAFLKLFKSWVVWVAFVAFLTPVIIIEAKVLSDTKGTFSYPVDDTFIHLAIAKNLAFHGSWGIRPGEFTSASSSLTFPIILAAALRIFGDHSILPFLINIVAAILLLLVMHNWLVKKAIPPLPRLFILLGVIYLTPLPSLAVLGMEHTLQLLFCFLFITTFSDELAELVKADSTGSSGKEWSFSWKVYLFGALMTATRYEGMYLVAVACLIVLLHRRLILAFQLGLLCVLPIFIFGFISVYNGNYFFPNSVLLKSGAPPMTFDGLLDYFTDTWYVKLSYSIAGYITIATQRLLFLLPLAFLITFNRTRQEPAYRYILILLTTAVMFHLSFTGYAGFPRYEAYLIGCSVFILGVMTAQYGRELVRGRTGMTRLVIGSLTVFLVFPLFLRGWNSFQTLGQACINIFDQQIQMARFLHTNYNHQPVALGDIGAVSYLTEGKNLDLVGLANMEVARSKREFYYTPDFLDSISRRDGIQIAIVYDRFNSPYLLQRWNKIATWQIQNNVTCGDAIVSFYAVKPSAAPDLKKNLLTYQHLLPKGVEVKYY
ncbi:hypothetical protein ACX0G9_27530 [Flavitalea flava]